MMHFDGKQQQTRYICKNYSQYKPAKSKSTMRTFYLHPLHSLQNSRDPYFCFKFFLPKPAHSNERAKPNGTSGPASLHIFKPRRKPKTKKKKIILTNIYKHPQEQNRFSQNIFHTQKRKLSFTESSC